MYKILILLFNVIFIGFSRPLFSKELSLKPVEKLDPSTYNKNPSVCCFIDWGLSWINQTVAFPDATVYQPKTKKKIKISSLVKSKPIILQLGSVTCPSYDLNIKRIAALEKKYSDQVDFYTVYVRENHPTELFEPHKNMKQKIGYAKKLIQLDHINHEVLVDDIKGSLHQALGNFGNSIYVIGKDMHINHWSIFPDAKLLEEAIVSILDAKGIAKASTYIRGNDVHPVLSSDIPLSEKKESRKKMALREGIKSNSVWRANMEKLYSEFKNQSTSYRKDFADSQLETIFQLTTVAYQEALPDEERGKIFRQNLQKMSDEIKSLYKIRYTKWKDKNGVPETDNSISYILDSATKK